MHQLGFLKVLNLKALPIAQNIIGRLEGQKLGFFMGPKSGLS